MKTVTHKAYLLNNIRYGWTSVHATDMEDSFPGEYVVLAVQDVTFEIPEDNEAEVVKAKVAAIQKQITKVRARAHQEISSMEDAIHNLLSITHQAEA